MSRRALVLFVALGVVWGVPYLFIKLALEDLEPVVLVAARSVLAALVVVPVALARRSLGQTLRRWRPVLAYSAAEVVVPWIFLARAERELSSSLTGLLLAAVPVVGLLIAVVTRRSERFGLTGLLGLAVGLLGVGLLVGLDVGVASGGPQAVTVAELGLVVLGYAIGPVVITRWLADVPASGVVAASLVVASAVYLPFALTALPDRAPTATTVWSVVVLAVLCTAVAFGLLFALVAEVGPVRATVITYLNPAVAVLAGVLVLGERVTVVTAAGFVLIVLGSVLATRRARPPTESVPGRRARRQPASTTGTS